MKRLLAAALLSMAASCLLLGCDALKTGAEGVGTSTQSGAYVRPGRKHIDIDDEEMEAWVPDQIMIPQNAWPVPDLSGIDLTEE